MPVERRVLPAALIAALLACGPPARAQQTPGVTAGEIKIGQTQAYSGPASAYGVIGRAEAGFFEMLNQQGGVNGRKIVFLSEDDGYSPPKTVEQTRRLVEQEGVAFMFNALGTPSNTAVQRYLNMKKVPQLFVATGADKWADPKRFPWTIGFQPSYRTEARIYARYLLENKPDAKVGVLYQNDDFGKDYLAGLHDVLGDKYRSMVIKEVSYEVTDPTIDSQAVSLQSAGVDALISAVTPKFGAQVIRKLGDMHWKPLHFLSNVSVSVGAVIQPAGPENAVGVITGQYLKDPTDPGWADDPGMKEWHAFMAKYLPQANVSDGNYVYAYAVSLTLLQVLKQCGADLSRANIMKQAASLHDFTTPVFLPGVKVDTSPTEFRPIRQLQLARWTGTRWERFGKVIEASSGS